MRVISVINLKGGVGKTTTTINMAAMLCRDFKKRVLIVDNDIQANASKFFERHSYDRPSIDRVYRGNEVHTPELIQTVSERLDILPANMNMDAALVSLSKNESENQIGMLKNCLDQVKDTYDFCIIDNPPGIGMNVLNALACTNDVVIPIKVDKYAMDGMQELFEVAEEMRAFNPGLASVKGLITQAYRSVEVLYGITVLQTSEYALYKTIIRRSNKVDSCSFDTSGMGLLSYSPRSAACIDYRKFVREYLEDVGEVVVRHA